MKVRSIPWGERSAAYLVKIFAFSSHFGDLIMSPQLGDQTVERGQNAHKCPERQLFFVAIATSSREQRHTPSSPPVVDQVRIGFIRFHSSVIRGACQQFRVRKVPLWYVLEGR